GHRHLSEPLGGPVYPETCTENPPAALAALGAVARAPPAPLNFFMNIPILDGRRLAFQPPVCRAGQFIAFRAVMDLIVAFSACPQDIIPITGVDCRPTEAHFTVG